MSKYTIFWKHGKSEVVEGSDFLDALSNAGYSFAHTNAIDFHTSGDTKHEYTWSRDQAKWNKVMEDKEMDK